MLPALGIKSKATLLVLLTVAITTLFALYTKETNNSLSNIETTWLNYQQNTLSHAEALTSLQSLTGYGGFFYLAQRYQSTQDSLLIPQLQQQSIQLKQTIAAYYTLNLNLDEQSALNQLESTVDQYLRVLNSATPAAENPVNDNKAIAALNLLIKSSLLHNQQQQQLATNSLSNALSIVLWANFLVPSSIILSIAFIAFMLKNISQKNRADINRKNLSAVIEASPDAMMTVTTSGLIMLCNRQSEQLFRTNRDKLINSTIQQLIDLELDLSAYSIANASLLESYAVISEGQKIPIEIGINKAQLNTQEIFIFTLRDITTRKNNEYTLLHNESRIRSILESVGEGVIGVNKTGVCTFVNPAALKLLNYPQKMQIVGENIHNIIHNSPLSPAPCDPSTCALNQAILEGIPFTSDHEVLSKADTDQFDAEIRSYPLMENNQLTGAVITFSDISEKRQHEERLRQTAMVFNATKDGIIITDSNKRIIATNQAFTELSGYTEKSVIGKHAHFHKYEDHRTESQTKIEALLDQRNHWQGEVWNRRKNNEIYPAWEDISCVKNDAGQTTNYTMVFSDISAIKESEQRLNHLAHHDILTGLPNRLLFSVNLSQTLERAKRHQYRVGLLFIDLDRFKIINDTLGHAAGDCLLEKIAQRLKYCVRAEDTVARLGGDEFTVTLSQINQPEDAALLAQKIHNALANAVTVEHQDVFISASIGISIFPDDAGNAEHLAKAADAAMYRAKENGRNNYQFYSADLTDKAMEHLSLEQGLRQAIARQEFILHYQPQFSLKKNCLIGVEALIRWQHPQLGLIPPDKFIHIAEEAGLIESIGEWVLQSVCTQIIAWRKQGLAIFRVSINISGRELMNSNILKTFKRIIEKAQLETKELHLELEITEGVLRDAERSISTLNELKALGISLAIDDFGTGYSSLSRLKHLPIDTLKIDRAFIKGLPNNQDDGAIACAVIALGRSLNLRVIAEGAETQEQLHFLRDMGCDEIQGFLLGRPTTADEIPRLIHTPPQSLLQH